VAREVLISLEEWEQMTAMEASGEEAQTKDSTDETSEFSYEYDSEEDPDNLDGGVPDEMPGEHRM
jgi:hypothetical protein